MTERTAEALGERIKAGFEGRQGVNERTAVYWFLDASGELIYAGATKNTVQRWSQHSKTSGWWRQVARREVAWLDSRPDALFAERLTVVAVLGESKAPMPEAEAIERQRRAIIFAARIGWSKYMIATELGATVSAVASIMAAARRIDGKPAITVPAPDWSRIALRFDAAPEMILFE